MQRFVTFLGEAFPPPKKTPAGGPPKPPGTKPPFGQEKKATSLPASNKFPEKGADSNADTNVDKNVDGPPVDPGSQQAGAFGQQNDMAMQMQAAQQEKEQQELQLRQQREAEEDAERKQVKMLRAKADAEVMAAFEDKFNADDDTVDFYPELLTFGQWTGGKGKDGQMDAGAPGQPGKPNSGQPEDSTPTRKGPASKGKPAKDEEDEEPNDKTAKTGAKAKPGQSSDSQGTTTITLKDTDNKKAEADEKKAKNNGQQKKW